MGANTFSTKKQDEAQDKMSGDEPLPHGANEGAIGRSSNEHSKSQEPNPSQQSELQSPADPKLQNCHVQQPVRHQQKGQHQMSHSFQQSLQNQISQSGHGKAVSENYPSEDFSGEDEEDDEYGCGTGDDSDDNCDDLDDSDEDDDQEEDDEDDDDEEEEEDDDDEDLEGVFDNVNMQTQTDQTQQFSNNFFIAQQIQLNRKGKLKLNRNSDAASILMQGFLKDASPAQRAEFQTALEQEQLKQIQVQTKKLTKQQLNQLRKQAQDQLAVNQAIGDSSDDEDMCHVNLLHLDENYEKFEKQQSKRGRRGKPSSSQAQRMRDKLQKPLKNDSLSSSQKGGQSQVHQQKLQRMKNQQQQQLKKGISSSQKQYREDKKHQQSQGQEVRGQGQTNSKKVNIEKELECQEEYQGERVAIDKQQHPGNSVQYRMQGQSSSYQTAGNGESIVVQDGMYDGRQVSQDEGHDINDEKYSDNSSQYEDIQNDLVEEEDDDQCGDDDGQSDLYNTSAADQEIENLLTENLEIPADMSPQFHRFYENFTKYIDFIIKYEYNILPQQKCYQNISEGASSLGSSSLQIDSYLTDQRARDAAQLILKRKYDNFKKLCDKNCKCFTGPYSVLQIFIEKIVDAIQSFAQKLRILAHDDLKLWEESKNTIRFAPLMSNYVNYCNFLQNVTCHYNLIIKSYAQAISTHFTRMTKVINGNSYEFPSVDMHRTIINKLIMNDSELFKDFFHHIKKEYNENEKAIQRKIQSEAESPKGLSRNAQNLQKFMEVYKFFVVEVQQDISKGVQLLNIDIQMQDLRRHALKEYDEIHKIEIDILNSDPSVKHYLSTQEAEKAAAAEKQAAGELTSVQAQQATIRLAAQHSEHLNKRYGIILSSLTQNDSSPTECDAHGNLESDFLDLNMLDPKEKKKLKKKQRKREKKIKQQMAMFGHFAGSNTQNVQSNQGGGHMSDAQYQTTQASTNTTATSTTNKQKNQPATVYTGQSNIGSIEANTAWTSNANNQGNSCDDPEHHQSSQGTAQNQRKPNKKKGKSGAKLSQEEINNLSTDELLSYIQNEGKGMKYKSTPQKKNDPQQQQQQDPSQQHVQPQVENKSMQNFRAKLKAKAIVASQSQPKGSNQQSDKQSIQNSSGRAIDGAASNQRKLDSNNFTCKYCSGSLDYATKKFVHDKSCQNSMASAAQHAHSKTGQPTSAPAPNPGQSQRKAGHKGNCNQQNQSEVSTQGSNSVSRAAVSIDAEYSQDEERDIQEFAKKLENIQKQPPLRYVGINGKQRRRRKLKPNVSVDWLNQLRKELSNQNKSVQNV